MKSSAIRFERTGGTDVLELTEIEVGDPGECQALIRQTAVGVNFIDTYHRSGLYPVPGFPSGLGMEAAGVVEGLGTGVGGVSVGDRVAYVHHEPGAYTGARVVPADRLVRIPEGIADAQAAAGLLKGLTVAYLVGPCANVKRGDTVLLHAAAGGVGLIACQWLRSMGARVIGTVGSREKAEMARAHGCEFPVLYREEDFEQRVREITGGAGVPVVFDSVGAATFEKSMRCLATRGLMVSFGNASGPPPALDVLSLSGLGSVYVTRPKLFDYTRTRAELEALAGALIGGMLDGSIGVRIDRELSLRDAAAAHRALEGRETTGSVVLIPAH